MAALDEGQIAQIRQVVRLEALRAAVYALASENLDENVTGMAVSCAFEDDLLGAEISWTDRGGVQIGGGRL